MVVSVNRSSPRRARRGTAWPSPKASSTLPVEVACSGTVCPSQVAATIAGGTDLLDVRQCALAPHRQRCCLAGLQAEPLQPRPRQGDDVVGAGRLGDVDHGVPDRPPPGLLAAETTSCASSVCRIRHAVARLRPQVSASRAAVESSGGRSGDGPEQHHRPVDGLHARHPVPPTSDSAMVNPPELPAGS